MRIKSTVLQVLAAACLGAGLLYAMGIEGGAQLGQPVSDGEFVTALVLVLAAVFFMRLGFAAQDAEERARKKVHKEPQNTVKGRKKVG
jgi:lipoprotein